MLKRRKRQTLYILTAPILYFVLFSAIGFGQQASIEKNSEAEPARITYSPKNIKESTAVYVFLGWIWLAIFVLIYIFRLKIKESDRLLKIQFFPKNKK
ncbi:MAG: hypothetical protein ACETWK_11570 [Candidatus Aminicenantaceae bacterium]